MTAELRGIALRLHGPLQAWGVSGVGDARPTLSFPTRSGVLGLLAACLGIEREETERLVELARGTRVHVRIDAPGSMIVDDQTIQGNPNASPTRQTIQSKRSYLCDASFAVVVVPGDESTLDGLADAVRVPVFAPYLGRRHCVPSTPLLLAPEVRGTDPISLFDSIPRGPEEILACLESSSRTRRSEAAPAFDEFVLDADDHPRAIRRVRLRDELGGPLARSFRERSAVHVRIERSLRDVTTSEEVPCS